MNTKFIFSNHSPLKVSHTSIRSKLHLFESAGEVQHYGEGQVLYNEGVMPRGVYLIKSGKVKIFKHGSEGKEQIIKLLTRGDFIGYHSLLGEMKHALSAKVLEEVQLCFVAKEDFLQLFYSDADISSHFVRLLCDDLRLAEERLISTAYMPVRGRLARLLLNLIDVYKRDGDVQGRIFLSRGDLAKLAGTAKETTIRLLSEFKSEHLISIDGPAIIVKDIQGLERITQLYV